MIFFPSFVILILSMILFCCCNYQEHQTVILHRTNATALVMMVSAFVVLMVDTATKVVGSF